MDATGWELAPDNLTDLPRGVMTGEIRPADAPLGVRKVATKIHDNWVWHVFTGEGRAIRQAYGEPRGDGTRPQLRVLEPCDTVSIRAEAADPVFPANRLHVAIVWARIERTGKRAPEGAWVWTCEPHPEAGWSDPRRAWSRAPRRVSVSAAAALLAGPPDDQQLEIVYVAAGPPKDDDSTVST
jgi:hypothetical protein